MRKNYHSQRYLGLGEKNSKISMSRCSSELSENRKIGLKKNSNYSSKTSFDLLKKVEKCGSKESTSEEFVVKFRKNIVPRAPKKSASVKKLHNFKKKKVKKN